METLVMTDLGADPEECQEPSVLVVPRSFVPAPARVGTHVHLRKGNVMAFGTVHHFPGGTKEQYEASIAAVHPSDGSLPDGQIFHAAGPSAGGWTIMAIHESQSSWERFRDGTLLPKLQAGIEGGFATPPIETEIDVYKLMP